MTVQSLPLRYGVAALGTALASAAWIGLGTAVEPSPYPFFFAAVAIGAFFGVGPSTLAAATGLVVSSLFYLEPIGSPLPDDLADWLALGTYLLVSGILIWLIASHRRSEQMSRRLHQEGQEARGRYLDLVDNLDAAVWEADPVTMHTTFASRGVERMLGVPLREYLEGKDSWERRIYPDDYEEVMRRFAGMLEGSGQHAIQYRMLTSEGRVIWIEDTVFVSRGEDGQVETLRGVMVDITARREAEERERAARDEAQAASLLRRVVDAAPVAIQTFDLEGNVTHLNSGAVEMFGWTEEEVLGRQHPYVPEEGEAEYRAGMRRCAVGERVRFETRRRRKDGSTIDVEIAAAPLRQPDGHITGILGIVSDISERKRAELELRQSEERFRLQYQSEPTPIFLWRCVGDDWELVDFNAAAEDLTQGKVVEARGTRARTMYRDVPEVLEGFETVTRDRSLIRRETSYDLVTTGEPKHLIVHYAFLPPDYVMVHDQDVTGLKNAEDALRREGERLEAIVGAQQAVATSSLDQSAIARSIAERAQELTGADGAAVGVLQHGETVFTDAVGVMQPYRGVRIAVGGSLAGVSIESGESQWTNNAAADPRVHRELREEVGVGSLILVPLRADDHVSGVLLVCSGRTSAFTERDVQTLELMAVFFAASMDHAHEFEARQAALDELAQSEMRYRRLVELSPDPIAVHAAGRIVYANAAAADLLGVSHPSKLIGSRTSDFVHPDYRELTQQRLEEVRRTGQPAKPVDLVFLRADGQSIDVEVASASIMFERTPAFQTVVRDITDRKLAEQALLESEERYRELFENANDVVFTIDLQGNFTSINRTAERLTGYSREQALGMNMAEVVSGEQLPLLRRMIQEKLEGVPATTYEIEVIGSNGSLVPLEVSTRLLLTDGRPVGIQGIGRDVRERRQAEEALRRSEERFRSAFEDTVVGMALLDRRGRFLQVNPALCRMFGYSEQELLDMDWQGILHPEEQGAAVTTGTRLLQGEVRSYEAERRYRTKDGHVIWMLLNVSLVRDAEGAIQHFIWQAQEVTERKATQEALRESEERYRAITETASDAIITIDERSRIVSANPATEQVFGYRPEELQGQELAILMPRELRDLHHQAFRRYQITGEKRIHWVGTELTGLHKNGMEIPLEVSFTEFRQNGVRYFTGFLRDITERKRAREALLHQALHDALTGLPNRTLLSDRLQQITLAARRDRASAALLLIDLDRFKDVNDAYGHHYGDLLLQQVAARLQGIVRESDTVARLGGDEFAVVLPDSDAAGAAMAARKILSAIGRRFDVEDQSAYIGASIGIVVYPDHGEDATTLLQRADVAMYVAKRGRGGFAHYSPEQDENSSLRLTLASDLRDAIDGDQLVLHYQPLIDLASRTVVGVEALVRWQHPQHGLIPPDQFITVAEDTGLIIPLTRWVLREAAREAGKWPQLRVSVNVSPRTLHDPGLLTTVRRLLSRLPGPVNLALEITESAIMHDPERAIHALHRLHKLGIRLAIDDFGTGYTSLSYLKSLPVDEIKIDKSFVSGMLTQPDDVAIVQAIVELAHNLGLSAVAEGVEQGRVLDVLASLDCDVVQGYYFSEPMTASDLDCWLRARNQEPAAG